MKKDKLESMLKEASEKRLQGLGRPPPPSTPTTLPHLDSAETLRVTVVRGGQSEQDIATTKAFIDAYATQDGFKCPRCPKTFTNADEFIEHIAYEINKSLEALSS